VEEVLLAGHAEVNAQNNNGAPPLFAAVQGGQLALMQALLAAGANPNLKDSKDRTALNYAIKTSPEIIQALLKAGTDPNTLDAEGRTPLSYATEQDGVEVINLLLKAKADPNGGTTNQPLFVSIENRRTASAELLLQAGADANATGTLVHDGVLVNGAWHYAGGGRKTIDSVRPLAMAVESGQLPMVQLLLKYKANPNDPPDGVGDLLCSAVPNTNMLAALLDAGAKAEARRPTDNSTPLTAAVFSTDVTAVRLLLKHHADPNGRVPNGSPLAFSALTDTNILEALLEAGVNVELTDSTTDINGDRPNWTLLAGAAWVGSSAAVERLLLRGANPNARDAIGNTPLHWAIHINRPNPHGPALQIVKLLLEHGADPNVRNKRSGIPLDWAKEQLQTPAEQALAEQIIALLRQHGALDQLPHWDSITVSRPSASFSHVMFRSNTNDWNRFTLLELIVNFYDSSESHSVPSGPGSVSFYPVNSLLPFPDLAHITIVRPSRDSTNATRRVVNLLNQTNGIDCSQDVPLMFGDTVEIPERDHALGESAARLLNPERAVLYGHIRGTVRMMAHGQTVELSFSRNGRQAVIDEVLNQPEARAVLLTSSDLSKVKVKRSEPKTGKVREWTLDCSGRSANSNPSLYPGFPGGVPGRPPLSYQWQEGANNFEGSSDFWLENGDVIEVPEK
jgi:ankyrin repeat protein